MVDFFKNDLVAELAFVEISTGFEAALLAKGEGLPKCGFALGLHPEDGLAAGDLYGLSNLVVGVIREECVLCISPAGSEPAITGNEHPMVSWTDDTHKKRTHLIIVR